MDIFDDQGKNQNPVYAPVILPDLEPRMPNQTPAHWSKCWPRSATASTALLSDAMDRSGRRHNVMHHRLLALAQLDHHRGLGPHGPLDGHG